MIHFREVTTTEPVSISCDRCGRSADNAPEQFEFDEYLSINHICGYESIIGDGIRVQLDLCQYCIKEWLLPIARASTY